MSDNKTSSTHINILKIFNYLGGSLIFFGIVFFIGMNWLSLNNFTKIFATLGSAIAAYLVGVLLQLRKNEVASSAFFLISALVLPVGLFVTLYIYGQVNDFTKTSLIVSSTCLAAFLLSYLFSARTVFLLFIVIFGSNFYFSLIDFIMQHNVVVFNNRYNYEFIILGLCYILFGRYLEFDKHAVLTGPLYFFGALYILSASYYLSGTFITHSAISNWKIITALLIFLFFFLSVPLKSKSFLYLAAIFLVIYMVDMSYKFAEIFGAYGWPLILVFGGLLLMAVGYLVFNLQRKIRSKGNT